MCKRKSPRAIHQTTRKTASPSSIRRPRIHPFASACRVHRRHGRRRAARTDRSLPSAVRLFRYFDREMGEGVGRGVVASATLDRGIPTCVSDPAGSARRRSFPFRPVLRKFRDRASLSITAKARCHRRATRSQTPILSGATRSTTGFKICSRTNRIG
jgi:hypothetical protein